MTNCPEGTWAKRSSLALVRMEDGEESSRGQSPEGGTHGLCQRGRLHPLPGDVAHHDGDTLILEGEEVVEVSPHPLGRVGRPVGQTDLESRNSHDRFEQARLEHLGDPVLVGVQLGILEGHGKSGGELLDEVQLRLAECGLAAASGRS